jgi:ankyrin repeat protein
VLHLALGDGKVNTDKNKMALVTKIVRLLCERGADVNAADNSGLRPIYYCAKTMNLSAAKYLLENKAEVNAADSAGHTALYIVAVDGHPSVELAETLMQKGGKLGKKRPNPLPRKASESQRKVRTLVKPLMGSMSS